jgi:hypothetical protein
MTKSLPAPFILVKCKLGIGVVSLRNAKGVNEAVEKP